MFLLFAICAHSICYTISSVHFLYVICSTSCCIRLKPTQPELICCIWCEKSLGRLFIDHRYIWTFCSLCCVYDAVFWLYHIKVETELQKCKLTERNISTLDIRRVCFEWIGAGNLVGFQDDFNSQSGKNLWRRLFSIYDMQFFNLDFITVFFFFISVCIFIFAKRFPCHVCLMSYWNTTSLNYKFAVVFHCNSNKRTHAFR